MSGGVRAGPSQINGDFVVVDNDSLGDLGNVNPSTVSGSVVVTDNDQLRSLGRFSPAKVGAARSGTAEAKLVYVM
jgi:hypothetical protein